MKLVQAVVVTETKVIQIDVELPHYSKRDYYGTMEYWRIGEQGQITRISVSHGDPHIWSLKNADHDWRYYATSGENIEASEFWTIYAQAVELLSFHMFEMDKTPTPNERQGEAQIQ